MKLKTALLVVLVVSVFLVGCGSKSQYSGYTTYNQPQGQQQGQYVGGGCGVAPSADYEDTPVEALNSKDSAL
ncbi:hypothetical protein HYX04_05730 [Candidatus Woesearchaeota archaeon]|nr:hypothetical protein [Candidatus Woesearchaeota archaeon]